jgi:hypothetical protein
VKGLVTSLAFVAALTCTTAAWADRVVVLPFTSADSVARPELDEARGWTREAVSKRGHMPANDTELAAAESTVKDGVADTSQEYVAAGKAARAEWTVTGHVTRIDHAPGRLPDGTEDEGYTTYRIELEACQVASGRVESVSREVIADDAPGDIAEMLGLLVRPEGIGNAAVPWAQVPPRRKPHPKPVSAPPPAEVKRSVHMDEPSPNITARYGQNHPIALGLSTGVSTALVRPDMALGPSEAMSLGGAIGYALPNVMRGLELRGNLTSQVLGPRAVEVSAGARWLLAPLSNVDWVFVGPEVLVGAHVALGGNPTTRFLLHGAGVVAFAVTDAFQIDIAADLSAALGSDTLVLAGGTARLVLRF